MVLLVRIVLGLIALSFGLIGLRFMFMPEVTAAAFFVSPEGVGGLSTIRGDFGGAFLATAAFVALGLRPRRSHWLHAAALLLGLIAAGRAVGLVVDGIDPDALTPFVIELVFVALLLIGAHRLSNA